MKITPGKCLVTTGVVLHVVYSATNEWLRANPNSPIPPSLPEHVCVNDVRCRANKGVLHLVDLAGSERLDRSGVGNDAQRLRETQAINKSLSCLADVFTALSAKSSHVPFRNSKLTYLMQVRLGGVACDDCCWSRCWLSYRSPH